MNPLTEDFAHQLGAFIGAAVLAQMITPDIAGTVMAAGLAQASNAARFTKQFEAGFVAGYNAAE